MKTVIEMAREAGLLPLLDEDCFQSMGTKNFEATKRVLERFAELVRADEREHIAQMIDNAPALVEYVTNDQGGCLMCGFTPKLAAASIRARGNT